MSCLLYPQFLKILHFIPKEKLTWAIYHQIEQLAYGTHPKMKDFLLLMHNPEQISKDFFLHGKSTAKENKQPSKKIIKDIMLDNYIINIKNHYKLTNAEAIKLLNKLYMYMTLKILSYNDFIINKNNEIINICIDKPYTRDLIIKNAP